ncbi:MAG: putative toxin-antitoxin system toxin component, PIN family [Pseudomonadota bacterium]
MLDTNVVLDWLVFRNAACAALQAALEQRRVRWLASRAMLDEMDHVLQRGLDPRWAVDPLAWRAAWEQHVEWVQPPAPARTLPRCTDPDDQKFIDLAIGAGARWLLTRDRALLKLARRAHAYGVEVLTPERWSAAAPVAAAAPAWASNVSIS